MNDLAARREIIRKVVLEALNSGKAEENGFAATSRKIRLEELFEEEVASYVDGWSTNELFDVIQGVTWGGEGCEEIYVVNETVASSLESRVVYKTIGGRDIRINKIDWLGEYLVFPYVKGKSTWLPAFLHPSLGGHDALDFSVEISPYERGKNIEARLNYRIARNIVNFPKLANYLVKYYNKLERREFEGKRLSEYNKAWYEYHRSRTPRLISKPKIVCKRMMRTPAFALDEIGYLPRDSVMAIIPTEKLNELKKNLERVLQNKVTESKTLEYALAFLNSQIFQEILDKRRSKKRGGYPIVDERLLEKLIIPKPTKRNSKNVVRILQGDVENIDLKDLYLPSRKNQVKLA